MKKIYLTLGIFLAVAKTVSASVTLSGSAVANAPTLTANQTGYVLIDVDGMGFGVLTTLGAMLDPNDSSTYSGFEVVGFNTVVSGLGSTSMPINSTFDLGPGGAGSIDTGDQFAVLIFEPTSPSPYTTTVMGDTFRIWTNADWTVPSDGSTANAGADFTQLTDAADVTGTVVPEPETYALLAGIMGLGLAIYRRRR